MLLTMITVFEESNSVLLNFMVFPCS